jgi:CIC family chloride channel protein
MGAVFAAAAQAPLTAAVIVLEMTGDYRLTLGVVMACAISYFLYGSLQRDTMYTVRLSRRGVRILRGAEVRPLEMLTVATAMRPLRSNLTPAHTLSEAQAAMAELQTDALVVADEEGRYKGVLEAPTVLAASVGAGLDEQVATVSLNRVPPVTPSTSLEDAMRQFALYDTEVLPVTEQGRLVGVLTRGAVLRAYQAHTAVRLETERKIELLREGERDPGALQVLSVAAESPAVGRAIRDLPVPERVVIVAVERGPEVLVPRGATVIEADDRIVVYANPAEEIERFRAYLRGNGDARRVAP